MGLLPAHYKRPHQGAAGSVIRRFLCAHRWLAYPDLGSAFFYVQVHSGLVLAETAAMAFGANRATMDMEFGATVGRPGRS